MIFGKVKSIHKIWINIIFNFVAIVWGFTKTLITTLLPDGIGICHVNNGFIRFFGYSSYFIPTILVFISLWMVCEIIQGSENRRISKAIVTLAIIGSICTISLNCMNGNYIEYVESLGLLYLIFWLIAFLYITFYAITVLLLKNKIIDKSSKLDENKLNDEL